jgi:DNA polymerase-3 subunit epsilon
MKSIWDVPFIVVDVETTGSDPVKNRIMDIACVSTIKGEIVSNFSSLINPHQFIPTFISKMTGISNEMAFSAPESREVLPTVAQIFSDPFAVFVAHNYKFDLSFDQQTFLRSGMEFPDIPKLCTLKLARRLLPKDHKKNVGALAKYFNVPIINRHRAPPARAAVATPCRRCPFPT